MVTGSFGLLVAPFLWPFFLAVIFHSLSLAAPFVTVWLIIKQPWKEKEEQDEEIRERVQYGKNSSAGKMCADDPEADDLSEDREKEGQNPVEAGTRQEKEGEPDADSCIAALWYQKEGRERIQRMKEKLEREGKKEFSVSKDGICTVRMEKGFQRVGVLRGFPGMKILSVEKELNKDGFTVKAGGNHIWIAWKRGNGRAL